MNSEISALRNPRLPEAIANAVPECFIRENDNAFRVYLAVKGWQPHELRLHVQGSLLIVQGERGSRDAVQPSVTDVQAAAFSRMFTLPACVDREKVRAIHKDGLLTIAFPKRGEGNFRRILIEVA